MGTGEETQRVCVREREEGRESVCLRMYVCKSKRKGKRERGGVERRRERECVKERGRKRVCV